MKHTLIILCLLMIMATSAFAREPFQRDRRPDNQASIDVSTWIDANQILMFVTNRGSFAYDQGSQLGKSDGLYFPYTGVENILSGKNTTTAVFASGIWIGGVSGTDTIISVSEYADDFYPGKMIGGSYDPNGVTDPRYRVYTLYSDSLADNPNRDYLEWPIEDGAPFKVTDSGDTVPDMIGDQMCWAVYNDANPTQHSDNDPSTDVGFPVEIRQTTFAFAREGALANIVFLQFQIFNNSGADITDLFVSLWADPDLGDAGDDLVGCDTALSLGYCYNAGADNSYGVACPAVGYDFFQGPLEYTGDPADTARMWGQVWEGYRNQPMSSFNKYINGTDPNEPVQTYRYMNGLEREGTPLIDPTTGNPTKFYGSGDPRTGEGFLDDNPADRRFMLSTGPFVLEAGDSTEIVGAVIIGAGTDRLKSITELKSIDEYAQKVYDQNFVLPQPPAKPAVTVKPYPGEILLTWSDLSEVQHGAFPFEGYSILQGPTEVGPWTDTLGWFDVKNGIRGIVDYRFSAAAQQYLSYVAKPGTDDGLRHYLFIDRDFVGGGGLVNYRDYYYRVEAYSFDSTAPSGEKTLTSASPVTARPAPLIVGTETRAEYNDTIDVVHAQGTAPGDAEVFVIDPAVVTGHDYEIRFSTDPDLGNVWHVIDVTTGDTVVQNWVNQSGASGEFDYPIADGLLIKVYGAAPSIVSFEAVANGAGVIDPPVAAAFSFQDFPTPLLDGEPTDPDDNQQVGLGHWGLHTGDDGGSCGGGTRGGYEAFLDRSLLGRPNDNLNTMGGYDYEMRFTADTNSAGIYDSSLGGGSIGVEAFSTGNPIWVPFELWRIGVGTPDDPTDDVRMVPWVLDIDENGVYDMSNWGCVNDTHGGDGEHSASGADNDPYTDWVYWYVPVDETPGDAGYQAAAAGILDGSYAYEDREVFARTVLVNWNGDTTALGNFDQSLPEPGTIIRIRTEKPNGPNDVYAFSTAGFEPNVRTSGTDDDLDRIKAVPNPYYLFSGYDNSVNQRQMKFTNLPEECTITIYNLMGDEIARIEKNDGLTEANWNVLTREGIPVASGIYIYVVDAPGFGQKIGKMAVFTEVEVLDQY